MYPGNPSSFLLEHATSSGEEREAQSVIL